MINSLIYVISLLDLQNGETKWIAAPLANSYEYKIIDGTGALSVSEYRQLFHDKGLRAEHLEVKRDLKTFVDEEELKKWIRIGMAGQFGEEGNERFVQDYFNLMKERGLMELNGKIGFPHKRLFVLIRK